MMQYGHTVIVKFQEPTTYKGARWHARLTRSGMSDTLHPSVTVSASQDKSPRDGAHSAAKEAMAKALGLYYNGTDAVAYGDLSPSQYVFIF